MAGSKEMLFSKIIGTLSKDSYKSMEYRLNIPIEDLYAPYVRIAVDRNILPSGIDKEHSMRLPEECFSFYPVYPTIVFKGIFKEDEDVKTKIGYRVRNRYLFNGMSWEKQLEKCGYDPIKYLLSGDFSYMDKVFFSDLVYRLADGCFVVHKRKGSDKVGVLDGSYRIYRETFPDKMILSIYRDDKHLTLVSCDDVLYFYDKRSLLSSIQKPLSLVLYMRMVSYVSGVLMSDSEIDKNTLPRKDEQVSIKYNISKSDTVSGSIEILSGGRLLKALRIEGIGDISYYNLYANRFCEEYDMFKLFKIPGELYRTGFVLDNKSYEKILSLLYFSVYESIQEGVSYVNMRDYRYCNSGSLDDSLVSIDMLYLYTFSPLNTDWYGDLGENADGYIKRQIKMSMCKPKNSIRYHDSGLRGRVIGGIKDRLIDSLKTYRIRSRADDDDTKITPAEKQDVKKSKRIRCYGFMWFSPYTARYIGNSEFLKSVFGDDVVTRFKLFLSKDGMSLALLCEMDLFYVLTIEPLLDSLGEEVGYTVKFREYREGMLNEEKDKGSEGRIFSLSDDIEYSKSILKEFEGKKVHRHNWVMEVHNSFKYNRYGGFNLLSDNPVELVMFFNGFVVAYNKYTNRVRVISGNANVDMTCVKRTLSIPVVKKLAQFHNLKCEVYDVQSFYGRAEHRYKTNGRKNLSDMLELSKNNSKDKIFMNLYKPRGRKKLCQIGILNGVVCVHNHASLFDNNAYGASRKGH